MMFGAVRICIACQGNIEINRFDGKNSINHHAVMFVFQMQVGRHPAIGRNRNAFDQFFGGVDDIASRWKQIAVSAQVKRMSKGHRFVCHPAVLHGISPL